VSLKVSYNEDDEKLGDPDGDTCSEKLSQTADNPSDKTGAQQCRLRSGTLLSSPFGLARVCYVCQSKNFSYIPDHRKEKSLGLLTQNFVKLFLTMEVSNSSYL
jgi:transcription factor E2F7/8